MAVCVFASYNILSAWIGNTPATLGSIALGILAYGVLALRMGAVSKAELAALPCGEFMLKIFRV